VLGKDAKQMFSENHSLPHVEHAGDMLYVIGFIVGLILWGFAIVWFVVAVIMIATSGGFPFNMGWWGFIFPVGQLLPFVCQKRQSHAYDLCIRCLHFANDNDRRGIGVTFLQGSFLCKCHTALRLSAL
jgi:hypothetical protein